MEPAKAHPLLVPAIAAAQFVSPFMFSGVAVALPAMGTDLHAGATSLGLVETLFLAGSVALLLPVGRLADASDKRTLYKLGMLSFGLLSLLIAVFSSVPVILLLRFLQGVASAVTAATGPAILADVVPPERRGRAYGLLLGAAYAGLTLGPICAGFLIELWGWRAVFWVGGALVLVGYLVMQVLLRSAWRRPKPGAVHLPSSALVVASMLFLAIGCSTLRMGALGYACLACGIALAAGFLFWQRRLPQPLLNVEVLMRNTVLRNALLVQVLLYTNAFSAVFMVSIYVQVVLEQSARTSGHVLAIGSLLMAVIAPLAGTLSDRYRASRVARFGVAVALSSAVMAMTLGERSGLLFVVLMLALQGVGFAFFSSPNMTMIMNSVPPERISIASALAAQARSLGMMMGMLITAAAISVYIGDEPLERNPVLFVHTMHTTFLILAALSLLALVLSLQRTRAA
jgi:MFS family permease